MVRLNLACHFGTKVAEIMMGNLRVIIVGAGIGGCAAALALQCVGCRVDVYEQAPEKTEVGAGIQISPNASRLLQRYGLGAELESVAVRPVAVEARRWQDGKILSREDLGESVATMYGAPYYHIHRADLLRILSAPISNDTRMAARRSERNPSGISSARAMIFGHDAEVLPPC